MNRSIELKPCCFIIVIFLINILLAQDSTGPCTCDLTKSACDPNCCCDTECTATDISAFSGCTNVYKFTTQSCFPSSVMYRNYTPYSINNTSDGLFCIYYDKFTARNYYTNPQVENRNVTKLAEKAESYIYYSFPMVTVSTDYPDSSYQAGMSIRTLYSSTGNPSYMRQPAAVNSRECSYSTPVLFMNNLTTACTRLIASSEACRADSALSLSSFVSGYQVVPQPSYLTGRGSSSLNESLLVNVTRGVITCLDMSGASVSCSAVTSPPSLSGTNCSNVLTSLTYYFKYRASTGIYEVSYDAILGSYNLASSYTLKQSFTAAFTSQSSSNPPSPRSGNPGYITGKPVLAGTKNSTTNTVTLNSDSSRWLTVPGAIATGACSSTATPRSVAFGESLQSGCWRQITWSSDSASACSDVSAAVRSSLAGLGIERNTVVGRFGNTLETSTADWLTVHVDKTTCHNLSVEQLTNTSCVNVLLGARLDLLVARTGSVTMPQNSIVGARLVCLRGNVTLQCSADTCSPINPKITQRFMTSYSVRFIDASSTPKTTPATATSIFERRVMRDFFYLLYVENGAAATVAVPRIPLYLLVSLLLPVSYWLAVPTN